MITVARQRLGWIANVEFVVADFMTHDLPAGSFDVVVSVAALHHVPLRPALERITAWLRPGGTLVVVDLRSSFGAIDLALYPVAGVVAKVLRVARTGRLRQTADLRRAWADHGRHDRYSTMGEVRNVAGDVLPGAAVLRRLLWRYSLVWMKPGSLIAVSACPTDSNPA
jgi:SAM-dependent methyltransferase